MPRTRIFRVECAKNNFFSRVLKTDVLSEVRISSGNAFHIGQIRMKNDSQNVDVRAKFKRRSIPEVPQRVLECENCTNLDMSRRISPLSTEKKKEVKIF